MKKMLFCLLFFFTILYSYAQDGNSVDIAIPANKDGLHLKSFIPFSKLQIIDSRFNLQFYNQQNTLYPKYSLRFKDLNDDIVLHYNKVTAFSSNEKKVVFNIKKFDIPNKSVIFRQDKNKENRSFYIRNYIFLYCDVYVEIQENTYKKLLTVRREYPHYGVYSTAIANLLNELITVASFFYKEESITKTNKRTKRFLQSVLKDSASYKKMNEENVYNLNQIEKDNTRNDWAAILENNKYTDIHSGFFKTFEDFKNRHVTPKDFKLIFNDKDSTYFINNKEELKAWAVIYNNELYFRFSDNTFLKLYNESGILYFQIPESIAINLYTGLSYEQLKYRRMLRGSIDNRISIGIEKIVSKKIISNSNENSYKLYRSCIIDLYNGDLLYR